VKKFKAGFIGTGGIAGAHLKYLASRNDVEIAALCDVDDGTLKEKLAVYGGRGYTDFHTMLSEESLDAVWICTPPQVRRDPLLACAGTGLPVFCEKPAERELCEAESISRELDALNADVQVGYVFRSLPHILKLKEELSHDKIHAFQSLYICSVSLTRSLAPWFYDKDKSGGALVDQATHNLDLLRFLFGEVKEVRGLARNPVHEKNDGYTIDEVLSMSLVFDSGTTGAHTHSWVGDGWRNEIILSGEKALYRLDLGKGKVAIEGESRNIEYEKDDQSVYSWENAVFLDQVKSGDWSVNPSSYADAVATLKLTLECDRALSA
jgi:predicted dehydrogenase